MNNKGKRRYIASLDIGTTSIKCHIYSTDARIIAKATAAVELLSPKSGYYEINPNVLWENVIEVMKHSMINAEISAADIICLGITSQRCSFVTWNKTTNIPFHNIITWKDLRAESLIHEINKSPFMRILRLFAALAFKITRSTRLLLASKFKFVNAQVAVRLAWMLKNNEEMVEAMNNNELMFGTIDTYLIYKLTMGKKHVTDMSSASATGLFDPFHLHWSKWILYYLNISSNILPTLVETSGTHFGHVHRHFFGCSIPITASVADQSAAMFGNLCFNEGDTKFTLGTGTFLNANTARNPIGSVEGLYPVVGWKYRDELVYLAEVRSSDTSALINWITETKLTDDIESTAQTAFSINNDETNKKYTPFFVPAFNGLQVPIDDSSAGCGFIGIHANTRSEHLIKSVLESIAFTCAEMYYMLCRQLPYRPQTINIDGGVSRNDYICKYLSNIINISIVKQVDGEATLLGAAYLAAIGSRILTSKEHLKNLNKLYHTYKPDINKKIIIDAEKSFNRWREAINRFHSWNT